MKLGKLNAAIDATPNVYGRVWFGLVALNKSSLKAALRAHFGADRTVETGLLIDSDNCLQNVAYRQPVLADEMDRAAALARLTS